MTGNSRTLDVIIQPQIPVFKGESYEFWSIKMKTLLKSHDLWDFVEADHAESSEDITRQKENERQDAKALFFIQQAVDESIFSTIAKATSAEEAWSLLRTEFGGQTQVEDLKDLVEIEVKSKVIVNHLGSNQEAAEMINNICKDVTWSESFYNKQYQEVNRHYHGYWSRNIAWLRRTYFNNPWNIVALFAGVLLFVLTVVQTIFTVNPRSD